MFKLNILFVVNLIIFVVYAEYQLPNPNEGECGKLPPSIPNRMRTLGGTMAKNGRFPWIVMIGYSFENSSENAKPVFQCDGSIISEKYVLTAAQCIKPGLSFVRIADSDPVVSGEIKHNDNPVTHYIQHPGYNKQGQNDIALLSLKNEIEFEDHIQPVCLLHSIPNSKIVGKTAIVANWKKLSKGQPNVMETIQIPVRSPSICNGPNFNADNQICTKGCCHRSLGGPLMMTLKTGIYQIGVTAVASTNCKSSNVADIHSSIPANMDWIKSSLNSLTQWTKIE